MRPLRHTTVRFGNPGQSPSKSSPDSSYTKIRGVAQKYGWKETNHHIAETGSRYVTYRHPNGEDEVTVRIADHQEAYPPRKGERRLDVMEHGVPHIERVLGGLHPLPDPYHPREETPEEKSYRAQSERDKALATRGIRIGKNRDVEAAGSISPANYWRWRNTKGSARVEIEKKLAVELGHSPARIARAMTRVSQKPPPLPGSLV